MEIKNDKSTCFADDRILVGSTKCIECPFNKRVTKNYIDCTQPFVLFATKWFTQEDGRMPERTKEAVESCYNVFETWKGIEIIDNQRESE